MRRFVVAVLLVWGLPTLAAAQAGSCVIDQDASGSVTGTEGILSIRGVVIRCEGGAEIRANEANVFTANRESHLFGNVVFQDAQRRLTSNTAIYNSAIGRLYATGDVVFTDMATGSTLRGPAVEYYRTMPGRPEPQVIATQRPHLTLVEQGQSAAPGQPLEVDADRTTIVGNNLSAFGSVVIFRNDLNATAGEAQFDRGTGRLDLRGNANVRGEEFNLTGEEIEAILPATGIERLIARRNANLTGEQLRVQAPELQLFFANDLVQRLVARRFGSAADATELRPVVTATGFRLEADSLEALSPAQQLDRVVAIGNARGEAIDTLPPAPLPTGSPTDTAATDTVAGPRIAMDRDWIVGDTVTGFFATVDSAAAPTRDSANIQVERLVAKGSARSLYRVRSENAPPEAVPALNYLSGESIELTFDGGELDVAHVSGLQRGVYLDPTRATATPADTAATGATPPRATPPNRRQR